MTKINIPTNFLFKIFGVDGHCTTYAHTKKLIPIPEIPRKLIEIHMAADVNPREGIGKLVKDKCYVTKTYVLD
jgi:hypothetical protein